VKLLPQPLLLPLLVALLHQESQYQPVVVC
jgi:hypothetical protein